MKQLAHFRLTLVILALLTFTSSAFGRLTTQAPAPKQAAAREAAKYPTVGMRGGKLQQDKSSGILYFDAKQREERRLVFQNGLVYDHTGKIPVTTRSKHRNQNNYVMDAAGAFYLFDEFTHREIRHSSIFAGGPVAGAGNIAIEEGHLIYIDADSGHYDSGSLQGNVLKELASQGITVGGQGKTAEAKPEKSKEKKAKHAKQK